MDASLTMRLYAHSQDEVSRAAGKPLDRVVSPSCHQVRWSNSSNNVGAA